MKKVEYGIWIYAVLCLILVLIYRYSTATFDAKVSGYNLSLWYPLAINLIFIGVSVISIKENKLLPIIGIIFTPISTYSFYKSWTDFNYDYLALFIILPVVLLLLLLYQKYKQK